MKNAHKELICLLSKVSIILTAKLKEEGAKGTRIGCILSDFKVKKPIKGSIYQEAPFTLRRCNKKGSRIVTKMMKMNLTFLKEPKNKFTAKEYKIRDRISKISNIPKLN